jgi:hypothetical protein
MEPQAGEALLQGTLGLGAKAVPVARNSIRVAHQQMYTIGIRAPHQGEQGAVIALVASKPAMRKQLEASVVTFYHDQGSPNVAAVCQ